MPLHDPTRPDVTAAASAGAPSSEAVAPAGGLHDRPGVRQVEQLGETAVRLMDSITSITPGDAGHVIVSGSHGGRSSAGFALPVAARLVVFNDAGVGKDAAGVVALEMLQVRGTAAVCVSHDSARIGDAQDAWAGGRISHLNAAAAALGLERGQTLQEAVLQRVLPRAPHHPLSH